MAGINCIGFTSANFGLGIAARNTVRLLLEKGHEVAIADLRLGDGRSSQDHSFDALLHTGAAPLPHAINLFHINPPQLGTLLKNPPPWLALENRLNVCVPFWEQTVLPEPWIAPLGAMDVVLCPSRFIEKAVDDAIRGPLPHVRHYPQTAFLQGNHRPDRVRFGLPEKGVLFVQSFEMGSDCERKNPWGTIEAFRNAFTDEDDAYLVVKLNNSSVAAGFESTLSRLHRHISECRKIMIIDRNFAYDEVLSLYESCDCLVSLHRSEGLGLGPMEAMLLGLPVIATGWSGNMDFMDEHNSCPVGFSLVPVESPLYSTLLGGRPVCWADPDISQAAQWMRRLYDQPGLREAVGTRAKQDMLSRQEECKNTEVFKQLEEMLFRKEYRAAVKKAVGDVSPFPTAKDQQGFFASISALLKNGETTKALDFYYRERDSWRETPEMMTLDEIMGKVREMKVNFR